MAHLVLSACAKRSGDAAGARQHVEHALQLDPQNALAHYAWAEIIERSDAHAAIESLERAIALQPEFAAAWQLLGILHGEKGHALEAADAFARVVALDPANARGHNNLGNALRTLGRLAEAQAAFERALALKPDYALAAANVAAGWRDSGEPMRAIALLRPVVEAGRPPLREAVVMLAGLLREGGALDEAEPLYLRSIEMAPLKCAGEWFNLARVYAERDELDRARDAFARAHAMDATDFRGALGARLTLPTLYDDAAQVVGERERYAGGMRELVEDADRLTRGLTPDQVLDSLRWTNFLLAYQGRDDRDLQAAYGTFASRAIEHGAPEWRAPFAARVRGERLRVGFASAFFHTGTAGRYFRSWVTSLPRDRFEVFVYHLHPGMDEVAREVKARADRFAEFGGSRARPSVVAPVIRADKLDALVFPELGMDHVTFALAALRLAPLQLAGWGHPVTSGHATIDAFVTCDAMEPPGAERQYTERLLRLPGIGTDYRRLAIPGRATRAQLGLPDDRVLLLCPQSLFKVHPDNDALFAEVLEANPRASLVVFNNQHARVGERYLQRLARTFEPRGIPVHERVTMLPLMGHDDYLRVNLACDAMLDTLYWSGGNTSLDALTCALPVVTLPGASMRGRQSMAMLGIVGVPELVASDAQQYVAIASRLAQDAAWRRDVAHRIADGNGALFDRPEPTHAFAQLLLQECGWPS
ncbi:MAG TPA: tetratricopeptide repeat protein [Casimicrobiaceae bacterium]